MKIYYIMALLMMTVMRNSIAFVFTHKAPIVFASECDRLTCHLSEASYGKRFLLATDFGDSMVNAVEVRDNLRYMMQISLIMTYMMHKPIIPLDMGLTRNLSVEDDIMESHNNIVGSLNLVRAFLQGYMGHLSYYEEWNIVKNRWHQQYILPQIGKCIRFMMACGCHDKIKMDDYYVGHVANVSWYEEQMTRNDSLSHSMYACSSHLLTVALESIDIVQRVENPICILVDDDICIDSLMEAVHKLNPRNKHGKITFMIEMRKPRLYLPRLIDEVQRRQYNVLWCCNVSVCRFYEFVRIHREKKTVIGGAKINGKDMNQIRSIVECLKDGEEKSNVAQWNRFSL